jgi:hypothetical protein
MARRLICFRRVGGEAHFGDAGFADGLKGAGHRGEGRAGVALHERGPAGRGGGAAAEFGDEFITAERAAFERERARGVDGDDEVAFGRGGGRRGGGQADRREGLALRQAERGQDERGQQEEHDVDERHDLDARARLFVLRPAEADGHLSDGARLRRAQVGIRSPAGRRPRRSSARSRPG